MMNLWGEDNGVVSAPVFSSPARIAVLGSRSFGEALVSSFVLSLPRGSVVLSGGCSSGADAFATRAALRAGLSVVVWPAPFGDVGASAGPRRSAALLRSVGPVGPGPVCRASVVPSSWLSLRAGSPAPACPGPAGGAVVPVSACVVFSSLGPSSPGSVAAVAAAHRAGVPCWCCSPGGGWSRG